MGNDAKDLRAREEKVTIIHMGNGGGVMLSGLSALASNQICPELIQFRRLEANFILRAQGGLGDCKTCTCGKNLTIQAFLPR